jgi:predicted glutamine amidotransferase
MMTLMGVNGHSLSTSNNTNLAFGQFTQPCILKLKDLSVTNNNGWALAWYDYTDEGAEINPVNIHRSNQPAHSDPNYSTTMYRIANSEARILLGHVRRASDPNTSHINNPHPFIMNYNGRDYSFVHNGTVNKTSIESRINQLDPTWLTDHPFVTQVDSERYFSWIMLNIHLENGNVLEGIKKALLPIYQDALTYSSYAHINFILSDGMDVYAYKQTSDNNHPLAYFYDMDNMNRGRRYTGVMSEFPATVNNSYLPIDWDSVRVTHQIRNNELVFLSSTGNIVRFNNFVNTQNNILYRHALGFHKGVNWVGFPIMENGGSAPACDVLDQFTGDSNGGLYEVRYGEDPLNLISHIYNYGWSNTEYELKQKRLYKLSLRYDTPSIHLNSPLGLTSAVMIDPNEPVLHFVYPDTPYWLSYTLLPSQNIRDAFGDSWSNIKSVRAEDWFYSIPPETPKGGTIGAVPLYSWTTNGKNMDFGKGYIVTFKQFQASFTWNKSYEPETLRPGTEKALCFEWEDTPDYIVIDIVDAENAENIREIGVMQGDTCIGAVKTDELPCQILAYPDYEDISPLSFEIVYHDKKGATLQHNYEILSLGDFSQQASHIVAEKDGHYIVKLKSQDIEVNAPVTYLKSVSNYPNPFNPSTNISLSLTESTDVNIQIYNIKGQLVRCFGTKRYNAGTNVFEWNGTDDANKSVSSGIYFIRINAGSETHTHKIVMMK